MDQNPVFLLEFLLFAAIALGWAGWEVWSLRRDRRPPGGTPGAEPPKPSEEPPRHPER